MTQGVKYDGGKLQYSLIPNGTLPRVVNVLTMGAKKYAPDNWKYVDNARHRYYDAANRHIEAWWSGQMLDEETGEHHLAHAMCCLLFLMWFDAVDAAGFKAAPAVGKIASN